ASTTILCVSGDCRTSWPSSSGSSFNYPFFTSGTMQATSTNLALFGGFFSNASSTVNNSFLVAGSSTLQTTAITAIRNLATNGFVKTSGGTGALSVDTTTYLSAMSFAYPFLTSGTIQATSSVIGLYGGFLSSASSTLASTTVTTLLATNASTTNLAITSIAASSLVKTAPGGSGALIAATAGTDYLASMTFAYPFTKQANGDNSTTTLIGLYGGFFSNASSTVNNSFLVAGSTTLQAFTAIQGTITSGTSTNWYVTNFLANGSTTLQAFTATQGTITSATSTNSYITNLLVQGSTTLQAFTATQGTITSATSTNLYATNLLAQGSTTLQKFTASEGTTTSFFATTANFGNIATDIVNYKSGILNFLNRATTTLQVTDTAWVIATNTAAAAYPLMSFNNSAGTSTIQFFGATTTGLTVGVGMGIPMGQFVLIGDGRTPSGLNILKGGLCVDNDGWCTASTTGRISSVSSFIGNADLAEMYQAGDYMEPGDVVAITNGITVIKATLGGRDKMMGVVSTKPGIVLGSGPDAEGRAGDVPIALAGRVPVKVSSENGAIRAGDYLTLSSVAGVAAKATRAGTTVGQALEDYSGAGTAKILAFIKNSYYSGLPLENFAGLTTGGLSTPEAILVALEDGARTSSTISSDLTADRMLAAVEIITPKLYAGLISAKVIESPTIDALSNRITTEVATLRSQIDGTNAALSSLSARVAALESATSTSSFTLAAATEAVKNVLASGEEWVVGKITAALGIFTRIEAGTIKISGGIEMTDSATGELYCLTLKGHEWDKVAGACGAPSSPAPVVSGPVPDASPAEPAASSTPPEASTTPPEKVSPIEPVPETPSLPPEEAPLENL
ncbi:hypothetical protein KW784_00735, partial [Candidatus Parcubacteria bacterium]|nr:hypothetical protein [Candidatus Parcubacteria bacterium]